MGYAKVGLKLLACCLKFGDPANGAHAVDAGRVSRSIFMTKDGKTCRVVASVLKMFQALNEKRNHIGVA
jgi:hypothetical protein